uniref:Uncharacterized protein n=1 Tax=Lepeophtheirus salmonis TaxID=72036 RepID=A0A0K2V9U4_LEPSM
MGMKVCQKLFFFSLFILKVTKGSDDEKCTTTTHVRWIDRNRGGERLS